MITILGYQGRFVRWLSERVSKHKPVGLFWIDIEQTVQCNVCKTEFKPPTLTTEKDMIGACPSCHTPFVFARA